MAEEVWRRIFQMKANVLKEGDTWHLEFDDNIVYNCPNPCWQEYIRNTCARFTCSRCRRSWPSNRVKVIFHMRLTDGRGVVKVRRYRQNCKRCDSAPMEMPSVDSDNIDILLEKLVEKIRIKCYHEDLGQPSRPFRSVNVNSPHEPAHCEACIQGFCTIANDFTL